jgi:hypothetical protein
MTSAQLQVLLALNLVQMRMADNTESAETGAWTSEIAHACARSNRSTATVLSQMRDFRWVASCHGNDGIGWVLTERGVAALERERQGAAR